MKRVNWVYGDGCLDDEYTDWLARQVLRIIGV